MTDSVDDLLSPDDLATSSDEEAAGASSWAYVHELPTATLRLLLRHHLLWMFIGVGVAGIAFVASPSGWFLAIVRWIAMVCGMGFAAIRLFQINGIVMEIRRRGSEQSPQPRSVPAASDGGE